MIVIEIYERDEKAKTGRWRTYRHRDGSKNVAEFKTVGAARRFVKSHALNLGQKVQLREIRTQFIHQV